MMMNIQHNSKPCIGNGGLKLFGVQLNTHSPPSSSSSSSSSSPVASTSSASSLSSLLFVTEAKTNKISAADNVRCECHPSTGLIQCTSSAERRKKGIPWSEEEHGRFLFGLEKLGKGDWRGISRRFVCTRTPTQVASHAQKYFLRQSNLGKRKRRSSLFDEIESLSKPLCFSTNSEDVVVGGKIETDGTNILNPLTTTEDSVKPADRST
ncbi:myb-like transcription factor family protein [Zostera marina]|uniref:Myb-like transcription factor family protein n=1 Tax=Zostera marina TaxID=29655 RepID=A0A0K9PTB2_ZOSMR|nr:myb-like transcription factor family protein [Zostera marina]